MSKKLRTSVFLLLGVFIFIFVLAGCNKTPDVRPNYIEMHYGLINVKEGDYALVKNKNELLAFVEIMSIDLDELAKYDDKFFKSNSLVVFNITELNKDTKNEIVSYAIDNGTITINMETTKQGSDGKFAGYLWILELRAKEASTITDIVILKNGEKLQGKARSLERLYTLHEALKLSWMTLDDIRQIAEYHRISSAPEAELGETIAKKIRELVAEELKAKVGNNGEPMYPNASANDVSIFKYYGEYNGCYAFTVSIGLASIGLPWTDHFDEGITFTYGSIGPILVWHE